MQRTTLEQFVKDPEGFIDSAQKERVLVTRNGQPLALVSGVAYKDEEDLRLEASPEFWRMIEESRRLPTISLKDVEADLVRAKPKKIGRALHPRMSKNGQKTRKSGK